jgi:hypothetical protein
MDTRKISSIVEIHGPTLTPRQTLLPTTPWIRIVDHYDPVALDLYLDQQDCQHAKIFQDFFWLPVDSSHETFFAPLWLDVFCKFSMCEPTVSETVSTSDCFNFMMYKPRLLRQHVVLELANRKLKTNSYTYSDTHDFGSKITPKYFGPARQIVYNNTADYNNFLRDHVFERSAVALITETTEPKWNNNMTFTEKTLWPMLSLNFPIWLGGYRQAELWKTVGFDTFDDVVDQTYQYESDPMLRIQLALDNNIKLLTDLKYVSDLRNHLMNRLKRNRDLVLNGAIKRHTDRLLLSIGENLSAIVKR